MSTASEGARTARQPWTDRWLLDAMRDRGHPLAVDVQAAPSAWESLEAAGIPTDELTRFVCEIAGAKPADVSRLGPEDAGMLSVTLAARFDVVPVRLEGRTLEVATANPLGNNLERDLAFACARNVRVSIASPLAIRNARARIYQLAAPIGEARLSWVVPKNALMPAVAPTRGVAVEMIDRIIVDAIDQRASDIHLEPQDGELLVRFRVDGVLHDVTRVPAAVAPLLMSRLKVGAGLDIADRLRPQDGRASMIFDGRPIDLRVSTLPLGERVEKAVIRILDASATTLDFVELGFTDDERAQLTHILAGTEGMVLVTGPTGSGKTTTLYSALLHMKSHETNIVTVEDPIEYRLEGVNQVQVNEKARLTFASALRSILRQDPDVVLVGEVRDVETAGIAIRASMTGHMVLSTLHTIDAASAIGRLADMGVDMSALAGALRAVIAQRLVRRLCTECSEPMPASKIPAQIAWAFDGHDTSKLRHSVGCAACRGTGYRGRMVVAEMLVIDSETQQLMARSTRRLEFLQLARKSGMHTLWETGLRRVIDGHTSCDELIANITPPIPDADLHQDDVDRLLTDLLDNGGTAPEESAHPTPATDAPPASAPVRVESGVAARGHARPYAEGNQAGWSRLVVAPRAQGDGRPRVLIANEDAQRRRALRKSLERAGCVVIEVNDGEAALSYACRLRPDAVVAEVALKKLDGIGLLQALVLESVVAHVFVYTDQRDPALLAWARELGARDALTTEDDVETVATRIRADLGNQTATPILRIS
jgi:type II secretory ATPase GspE/PulE/Tfp pilus assembly ATPase PilB-like protein/ActR/RegA family two-component response regulator